MICSLWAKLDIVSQHLLSSGFLKKWLQAVVSVSSLSQRLVKTYISSCVFKYWNTLESQATKLKAFLDKWLIVRLCGVPGQQYA